MLDVLTLVVLVFVGTRLVGGTRLLGRRDVREHVVDIVRGLRVRHFALAPPVLFLVILVAIPSLYVPVLNWGWWSAIGGVGNPVLGVTDNTAGSPLEWIVPVVFAALLIPALPQFAEAEERRFRMGAERWSNRRRVGRAVQFGLAHCIIGIPIGVGLSLSIGGLYFTWAYLRGGVPESTRAHLAYNLTVVLIVAASFAFGF